MILSKASPKAQSLSEFLMRRSIGIRHGLVIQPQQAMTSMSDIASIVHMGVPNSLESPWQSAAGGVGRSHQVAELAAIGESIERSSSAQAQIPMKPLRDISGKSRVVKADQFALFTDEQRNSKDFPHQQIFSEDCPYAEVYSIVDNSCHWAPQPLVTLQDDYRTGVPTSSGLAAGHSPEDALLRGAQELIERDALMVSWLHGLPGRRIEAPKYLVKEVRSLGADMVVFDLTPAYSPFPVAAVMGGIKKRGSWRYSLGLACRETWDEAVEKAYLEWNQGILFTGIYGNYVDVSHLSDPYSVKSFDEHAMFYTVNPSYWHDLAIFEDDHTYKPSNIGRSYTTTKQALSVLRSAIKKAGMNVYYREITTIDALQAGLHVVKVLSPDMAMISAHQQWPFLGKVESMCQSRCPERCHKSKFPYLMPHPLG